jgi:putative flippase GtrA
VDVVTSRIRRIWAWAHTHEGRKIIRFTSVSVISTIVSNVVLITIYGFRWIPNEVWATIVGNLVATVPSYQLNRTWTWGKRGRSHLRTEIIPFWTMSLFGIAFSTLGASYARHVIHAHHWAHLVNTALVAGANLLSFVIFWFLKLWIFNRIFRVDELAEVDAHLTAEEHVSGAN